MLAAESEPALLAGLEIVDHRGERVGKVRQVYRDGTRLGWVAVRGNVSGTQEALVPLEGAVLEDNVLAVAVARSRVLAAPRRPADQPLEDDERDAVVAHYAAPETEVTDLAEPDETTPAETTAGDAPAEDSPAAGTTPAEPAVAAQDPTAPEAGEAGEVTMTAFRERMRVSTERVPTVRVRLTKTVLVEEQTATVTVRREEVRLVREPIAEGEAVSGVKVGAAEQEVVLHEERVIVGTEVIPVEQVRLVVDEVLEDRDVSAEVRHERIELTQEADPAT